MRVYNHDNGEFIAAINGPEILPALISMEHMRQGLQSSQPEQTQAIDTSIALLQEKQNILDDLYRNRFIVEKGADTEAEVDAITLRLGLEGILDGVKRGRERRLVKGMVRKLHKAGIAPEGQLIHR